MKDGRSLDQTRGTGDGKRGAACGCFSTSSPFVALSLTVVFHDSCDVLVGHSASSSIVLCDVPTNDVDDLISSVPNSKTLLI